MRPPVQTRHRLSAPTAQPVGASRDHQALSRRTRQRPRLASPLSRRDPRTDRRERLRQVDADQDAVRRLSADGGSILRSGAPVALAGPIAAREAGIATVFQEFSLVPTLSRRGEHLSRPLAAQRRAAGRLAQRCAPRAARVLADDGCADRRRRAGRRSVGRRAADWSRSPRRSPPDASMIILDEPTTALGLAEIARLHALLRRLKANGRVHPLHLASARRGGGARRHASRS